MDYSDDKQRKKDDSRYVSLPKIGEKNSFTIKTITKKTEGDKKYHFIKKIDVEDEHGEVLTADKNLGYHYECGLDNGKILSINNLFAWDSLFVSNDVQEGETIEVEHPEKGLWVVNKVVKLD